MEDQSEEKIDGFFSETLEDLKTQPREKNDGFFVKNPVGLEPYPQEIYVFSALKAQPVEA